MVIGVKVTADTELFEDIAAFLKQAPDLFNRKMPAVARRVSRFAKDRFRQLTPPSPAGKWPNKPYPLRWTSDEQRNYVMMMLKKRGTIPYRRTGRFENSYAIQTELDKKGGGVFNLTNNHPAAKYIIGARQQWFHKDIGWPKLDDPRAVDQYDELREIVDFAEEELINLHQSLILEVLK